MSSRNTVGVQSVWMRYAIISVFVFYLLVVLSTGTALARVEQPGDPDGIEVGVNSTSQEIHGIETRYGDQNLEIDISALSDRADLSNAEVEWSADSDEYIHLNGDTIYIDAENAANFYGLNHPFNVKISGINTTDTTPDTELTYTVEEVTRTGSGTTSTFDIVEQSVGSVDISPTADSIEKDGSTTYAVSVTSTFGNPYEGVTVVATDDGTNVEFTPTEAVTDVNGEAEFTVSSTDPQSETTLTFTEQDEDQQATALFTVLKPAEFAVAIDETNAPITEGDTISVDVTVTNTGEVTATQTVNLTDFDGIERDSTELTLDGGESHKVTLEWQTQPGDSDVNTVRVWSENNSDTESVTIHEPANFTVTVEDTNAPITEGDDLFVDVSVTNTGEATATRRVNLTEFEGVEQDSIEVTLDGAQTNDSITLQWSTSAGDAGTDTIRVGTPDDSDTSPVWIRTPPDFEVEIVDTNAPIADGEILTVDVTVTNIGETKDTQQINLTDFDSNEQDTLTVTLDGGQQNDSVTLEWATTPADASSDTLTVSSANRTDTKTVTIEDVTAPVPEAGDDVKIGEDTSIPFNGSATDNVEVVGYWWNFDDGVTSTDQNTTHAWTDPGVYTVRLNTSDFAGNNGTDTVTVTVIDTTDPTAEAGSDQSVDEGAVVQFNGTQSTDNVGVVGYNWTFGDGTNATGAKTIHTYSAPGTYTVVLNASDAAGNYANDTLILTVQKISSGNGGSSGGGSGGGGSGGNDESESAGQQITVKQIVPADQDKESTNRVQQITIEDAQSNSWISIDLSEDTAATSGDDPSEDESSSDGSESPESDDQSDQEDSNVVMDRVEMTVNRGGSYQLDVDTREVGIQSFPGESSTGIKGSLPDLSTDALSEADRQFVSETGSRPSGYIQIDHAFPDSDVRDVSLQFRVRKSYLSATGIDPEAVQLYRDEPEGWRMLSTQQIGESDEYYQFVADSPGLSLFTIGAAAPVFEIQTAGIEQSSSQVPMGDPFTVTVTVQNVGGADGRYSGFLTADGTPLDEGIVSVPMGATRTIELGSILQRPGTVDIALNGRTIGPVEVLQAGNVDAEDDRSQLPEPNSKPESGDGEGSWWLVIIGAGLVVVVALAIVPQRK